MIQKRRNKKIKKRREKASTVIASYKTVSSGVREHKKEQEVD